MNLRNNDRNHASCSSRPATTIEHVADRYSFPQDLSGEGESIAILAFGGGISVRDLTCYFDQQMGRVPDLQFRNSNAKNQPNLDSHNDTELALDLQVAGRLAPGARIVTYFGTNDQRGWIENVSRAIHDPENRPSVLSISWGATEDWWEPSTLHTLNHLFREAAESGITVCAASGDDGCARDLDGYCRVTFPASSPYVLACGGSSIAVGDHEVVWNVRQKSASGGGISDRIPRPDWQNTISSDSHPPARRWPEFDGRQLPDVSGLASRIYSVYVGGLYRNGAGGTSAVAPLWAALIARLNEGLRKRGRSPVGYFHPRLYRDRAVQETFREIRHGHNDPFGTAGYEARSGWSACTGWGSPNGNRLLDALLNSSCPLERNAEFAAETTTLDCRPAKVRCS